MIFGQQFIISWDTSYFAAMSSAQKQLYLFNINQKSRKIELFRSFDISTKMFKRTKIVNGRVKIMVMGQDLMIKWNDLCVSNIRFRKSKLTRRPRKRRKKKKNKRRRKDKKKEEGGKGRKKTPPKQRRKNNRFGGGGGAKNDNDYVNENDERPEFEDDYDDDDSADFMTQSEDDE